MNKYLILFILILSSCGSSFKSLQQDREEVDLVYKSGEYLRAAQEYELIYKAYNKLKIRDKELRNLRIKERGKVAYRIARIYNRINKIRKASQWYNAALRNRIYEEKPIVYFHLGKIFQQLGKIEPAISMFNKYLEYEPNDKLSIAAIKACKLVKKWESDAKESEFKEIEYYKRLNTIAKEYAITVGDEYGWELYFTSNRKGTESEDNEVYGELFTNIFFTKKDAKGKWSEIKPIDNSKISTAYSDGTPSFSSNFKTMFYTHCEKRELKKNPCTIYTTTRKGDSWADPKEFTIPNTAGYSVGHPSINRKGDTLFFSSDMKGGFGGRDIWYTAKTRKGWSSPVNMGSMVNTRSDEVFPYSRHQDNKFFFSSNGHMGMGGLDIFEIAIDTNGNKYVNNLKAPLNSRADDFGIFFDNVEKYYQTGYFSSGRKVRASNDDIFKFARYPKEYVLRIFVLDAENKSPIEKAKVKIAGTNGIDKNNILTNEKGLVNIPLSEDTKYIFAARKKNYLIDVGYRSTIGIKKNYEDILDTLFLVSTYKPIIIPDIIYKKNSFEYTQESEQSLNELFKTMKNNPEIKVELRAHSDYTGQSSYNLQLSQRRANVVVDYLLAKKIEPNRLKAVGKGESEPLVIDQPLIDKYQFFNSEDLNQALDSTFIVNLDEEYQEIARSLNRRTDLKVINNE